jgi:hypothetical protein
MVLVVQEETLVLLVAQMQVLEVQAARGGLVVLEEHLVRPELMVGLVVPEVQDLPVIMALVLLVQVALVEMQLDLLVDISLKA